MIEIIKIISIFPIFFLFLIFPFNTYNKNKLNYDLHSLNLMINLNLLLFFSFLPIGIPFIQGTFLLIFTILIIYKILNKNHFNLFYSPQAFLMFFLSFILISLSVANTLEFGWDAKYFNYIKTLFFYEGLNLQEIKNFSDYSWHPHLGSYIWAFFWKLPLISSEYFGRLFYVFIFCFSLVTAIFSDKKKYYYKIIMFLASLILLFSYKIFSGLHEVLIFSLLIISSKFLYELKKNNNTRNIIIIILIANALIWIKSEGLVYAITIITILLINNKIDLRKKIIVAVSAIFIIFFKKLVYIYLDFNAISQPIYNLEFILSLSYLDLIHRLVQMFIYLSYYSLTNTLFSIGIIIVIYLNFIKTNKLNITIFNYFFLLNLSFIFCAYMFREQEIVYSLRTTADRVIFTSSGFYLYLIYLFLNKQLKS